MKYIGSFFRMNSISAKEIESQLLFFSRESVKHLVLDSRCGVPISQKTLKKSFESRQYNNIKELNPIMAIYKKAKPNIYYSKHSKTWDETTFKKEILISSNALMTLNLLKLASYYKNFKDIDDDLYNLSLTYIKLAKIQLDFYYKNLRNTEGFFVDKKNISSSNNSYPELVDKSSSFSFSDQAYMMLAYYLYSTMTTDTNESRNFKNFSFEILDMFDNRKEFLYDESFEECCHICFVFNIMYELSQNTKCKNLLLDMSDFILSRYQDNAVDTKNLNLTTMTSLNLYLSYRNTKMLVFKEAFMDICKYFKTIYNDELSTFIKPGDKKDVKYYNIELILYLVNLLLYNREDDSDKENDKLISEFFKNSIVNSSIITSFPDPPTLDSSERYKHFSLRSTDLLDDLMFNMPETNNPSSTLLAPVYLKNTVYSKKKRTFSSSKTSFESFPNLFVDFLIICLFNDDYINFICPIPLDEDTKKERNSKKPDRIYREEIIEDIVEDLTEEKLEKVPKEIIKETPQNIPKKSLKTNSKKNHKKASAIDTLMNSDEEVDVDTIVATDAKVEDNIIKVEILNDEKDSKEIKEDSLAKKE
ncbi:hypothetical protein [Clostridium mediterraneense]|uniref:hypothetical protein n=1 Tax=Clostridium mediterraneense TaxID=1805472 RepID=UPI0008370EC9|nr:hypothetical protein [Clostridium mediterraneense]